MAEYYQKVLSRAWRETRDFWSSYRWWLSLSPPVVSVGILLARRGWGSLIDAKVVLLNAAGGTAFTLVGTWLISVVRSARLLDGERALEVSAANTTIQTQAQRILELESKKRSPSDEYHYQAAKAVLEKSPADTKLVLREIMTHKRLVRGMVPPIPGVPRERVKAILNEGISPLVKMENFDVPGTVGVRSSWVIVAGYEKALEELLSPDQT